MDYKKFKNPKKVELSLRLLALTMNMLNAIIKNGVIISKKEKELACLAFFFPLGFYVLCSPIYITLKMVANHCPCCYYKENSDNTCECTHECCGGACLCSCDKFCEKLCHPCNTCSEYCSKFCKCSSRTLYGCISIIEFVFIFFGGILYYTGDNLRAFLKNHGETDETLEDIDTVEPLLLVFAILLYQLGPLFIKMCKERCGHNLEKKGTNFIITTLGIATLTIELDSFFTIVETNDETKCSEIDFAVKIQWALFAILVATYVAIFIFTLYNQYCKAEKNSSSLKYELWCTCLPAIFLVVGFCLYLLTDNKLPINCEGTFIGMDKVTDSMETAKMKLACSTIAFIIYLLAFILYLIFLYKQSIITNHDHNLITLSAELQRMSKKKEYGPNDLEPLITNCVKLGKGLWRLGKGTENDYNTHEVPEDRDDPQTISYNLQSFSYDLYSVAVQIKRMESKDKGGTGDTLDCEIQPIRERLKVIATQLKAMGQKLRTQAAETQRNITQRDDETTQAAETQETQRNTTQRDGEKQTKEDDELKRMRVELLRIAGTPPGPEAVYMQLIPKCACPCTCSRTTRYNPNVSDNCEGVEMTTTAIADPES